MFYIPQSAYLYRIRGFFFNKYFFILQKNHTYYKFLKNIFEIKKYFESHIPAYKLVRVGKPAHMGVR